MPFRALVNKFSYFALLQGNLSAGENRRVYLIYLRRKYVRKASKLA